MLTTREQSEQFRQLGKLLAKHEEGHFEIRAGDIYEAKTIRGHTNLIIALRIMDGWMFYGHGDKLRKVPAQQFFDAVENGDLELKFIDEVDVERLALCQIALDAIANRSTFEKAVDMQLERAEAIARGECGISDQE